MTNRRQFGVSILGGAALSRVALATPARGNAWAATGRKVGVSHQRPQMLTEDHLAYLRQAGVEYLEVRIPSAQCAYDNLVAIKRKVEGAGLKLFEIMLEDKYSSPSFTLGLPDRDRDIALLQNFIRDLGRAGIDATTYAWNTAGSGYSTGETSTRGCKTRLFEQRRAPRAPEAGRTYTEDELWTNYEYFIRRLLPVAESSKVRLQLHPNDPPVDYAGVPRLFKSRAAFRRALDLAGWSPHSGLLFCTGTWAEMRGPDGKGEDVVDAIREFGGRGRIFQVHYRNVSAPLPDFHETFPDDGYLNMYRIMRALGEANFNGMVVPDHVPGCANGGNNRVAEAWIFGYIRAMIQAVDTELSTAA
jgi:mannonate dehydratase